MMTVYIIIGVGIILAIICFGYAIIKNKKKFALVGIAVAAAAFVIASIVIDNAVIPYGSLEFQNHHYYIFSGSEISWEEAENNCHNRGGYMAIINNAEENEALYNYMLRKNFEQAFFGLTKMPDGNWGYLSYTDETSDFRDWGSNSAGEPEPNNADGGEVYAELDVNMSDGHWNDAEFGKKTFTPYGDEYKDTSAYICEWDY